MKPSEMKEAVFGIRREDMWDLGGFFGLLKGQLFQNLLETNLPCTSIERCKLPFGTTAFDILRLRTSVLHQGSLATAIRASCTFPLLFQPVWYGYILLLL
jgi:NTE family protein